jgi:hypothetical protein
VPGVTVQAVVEETLEQSVGGKPAVVSPVAEEQASTLP